MLVWLALGVGLLVAASVRPQRFRGFLNDLLLVPVQLARDLAAACEGYIKAFSGISRKVLAAVGIEDHLISRAIGSVLVTGLGAVSLLAEWQTAALTFSALGFGPLSESLAGGLPLSAVDTTALVFVAGGAIWGIVLLDLAGLTTSLPFLFSSGSVKRIFVLVSAAVLAGCAACAVALASFRSEAISAADGVVAGPSVATLYVLVFLGVLTLVSGVVSMASLPAALGVILVVALGALLLPAALGLVLGRVVDRVVTLVFNVIAGVVALIGQEDDPVDGSPAAAPGHPPAVNPGAGHPAPGPATVPSPPVAPTSAAEPPPPVTPFDDQHAFDPLA